MNSRIFVIIIVFALSLSCSTSKSSVGNENKEFTEIDSPENTMDLTDHLRRVPGVQVQGSGDRAKITIRGNASLNLSSDPLYVLDGNIVSGGYPTVYSMVNVNDIKRVQVLKDVADTGIYGSQGANGVILITTKKQNGD